MPLAVVTGLRHGWLASVTQPWAARSPPPSGQNRWLRDPLIGQDEFGWLYRGRVRASVVVVYGVGRSGRPAMLVTWRRSIQRPWPCHRPRRARLSKSVWHGRCGAPGPPPDWVVSGDFTRGCVPIRDAPAGHQGLMNNGAIPSYATEPRHFPLGIPMGRVRPVRVMARRAGPDRFHRCTAGPHPASLSSRPPAMAHPGTRRGTGPAHRSSRHYDKAYADRCHARGRNPRRGTGR